MNTCKILSALLSVVLLLTLAVPAFAANTAGDKVVQKITVKQKGASAFTITGTFDKVNRTLEYHTSGARFAEVGLPFVANSRAPKQNRIAVNSMGDPVSFAVANVVRNDKVDQITYTFANSDRVTNYYFDKNKKGQVAYISNDKTELYEIVYGDNGAITAIKDFRNQSYNAYDQYDFNENGKQTAKWHKSEGYGTKNENTRLNGGISKYAAAFDDAGRLVRWADDVGEGKIVTTTFTYNPDGTVKSIHEESNDGTYVMDYTYEYMTI